MRVTQLRVFSLLDEANGWLCRMARLGVEVTVHDVKCRWNGSDEGEGYEEFLLTCSAELEVDSDNWDHFREEPIDEIATDDDSEIEEDPDHEGESGDEVDLDDDDKDETGG
jgi:hypothetical protein